MKAQLYRTDRLVRIFDDQGEAIADVHIPRDQPTAPQGGSRALMRLGLVRIGGWRPTDWGWEIPVEIN